MTDQMLRFFGRRKGKGITSSRQKLLDHLMPKLLIKKEKKINFKRVFPDPVKEVWLEVGFGGGEHVADLAKLYPDVGFVGAEPFINGVASLLAHLNGSHSYPKESLELEPDRPRLAG